MVATITIKLNIESAKEHSNGDSWNLSKYAVQDMLLDITNETFNNFIVSSDREIECDNVDITVNVN